MNDSTTKTEETRPVLTSRRLDGGDPEGARRTRRSIFALFIVLALGVGFGKIVAVDSVPDRAIQNARLEQIPKTLQEKEKELRDKGVSDERIAVETKRVYNAALRDAAKARPTLSANDRSRWLTIRALVEPESRVYRYVPALYAEQETARIADLKASAAPSDAVAFVPGWRASELNVRYPVSQNAVAAAADGRFKYLPQEILRNCASDCAERFEKKNCVASRYEKQLVPFAIDKAWETPGWDSIDVVKHGLSDEVYDPANPSSGYLYSSKPPLLPAVMAVPYWVLNRCFGLSLVKNPFETTRVLLVFYQLIPLGIAFFCLASIIDSVGKTDWGKFYAIGAATFGTFALAFVATLNNHLPGFACVSIALWAGFQILREGKTNASYFALAGFFGAFSVACELPALAFAAFLCGVLFVRFPKKTALIAVPFGLVVAVAFLATNYVAHQTFSPAYAQKRDHMKLANAAAANSETATANSETAAANSKTETANSETATANSNAATNLFDPNDWYYYRYYPSGKARVGKNVRLSHWANRTGIDRGEPSIARYAFHSTIGTRGVFSLTPIWLFSVVGLVVWSIRNEPNGKGLRWFALGALALTAIFFAFFLTRDQGDRNYGGASCCPRWFFPLVPLLIPALLPVVDKMSTSKFGRFVAYAALLFSAASAAYPTWSPWTSPWLYRLAVDWGAMTPY